MSAQPCNQWRWLPSSTQMTNQPQNNNHWPNCSCFRGRPGRRSSSRRGAREAEQEATISSRKCRARWTGASRSERGRSHTILTVVCCIPPLAGCRGRRHIAACTHSHSDGPLSAPPPPAPPIARPMMQQPGAQARRGVPQEERRCLERKVSSALSVAQCTVKIHA